MTRTAEFPDPLHIETNITAEQLDVTIKNQGFSLPANAFIAASTAFLTLGFLSVDFLVSWFALIAVVNWTRLMLPRYLRKRMPKNCDRSILAVSWVGALIGGLCWSILPLRFWYQEGFGSHQLICFMLAGMTAGAVVQSTAHAGTAIAFLSPILAAIFVTSAGCGTVEGYVFAANVLFYTVMLMRSARMAELDFRQSSRLRHEAHLVAAELESAHAEAVANASKLDGLANRDSLTGLANRGAFTSVLAHRLDLHKADGQQIGLLLLDLDNFKGINDTFGHGVGDLVLVEVAARLKNVIRKHDLPARLGGDEFAIMLGDDIGGEPVAKAILATMEHPMIVAGHRIDIGVSIGVASSPHDGATGHALLASADLALYAAKDNGRNRLHRFDGDLQKAAETRRDVELDLTNALRDGSIEVWFQPQVCLRTGALVGVEALLRWNHPRHGWIAPPNIVKAAMTNHHAEELTGYVLEKACGLIQDLVRDGDLDVIVAVNVSPRELGRYSLVKRVAATLAAMNVPAGRIEIEITEEAFIANKNAIQDLNDLKDLGVRIAIDDFGTGYSSLAYLSQLRVDRIKIDRSFISAMSERAGDRILVQAILGLGHKLGLEVVAEGVEQADDVVRLTAYGCRVAQGYYFGKPMDQVGLRAWIAQNSAIGRLPLETAEYSYAS